MGRIVGQAGQAHAAIIDFGGFLGIGNHRVTVAWNALQFPPDSKDPEKIERIGLDLNREEVRAAASEYRDDEAVVVLGASGALESLPFPQERLRHRGFATGLFFDGLYAPAGVIPPEWPPYGSKPIAAQSSPIPADQIAAAMRKRQMSRIYAAAAVFD